MIMNKQRLTEIYKENKHLSDDEIADLVLDEIEKDKLDSTGPAGITLAQLSKMTAALNALGDAAEVWTAHGGDQAHRILPLIHPSFSAVHEAYKPIRAALTPSAPIAALALTDGWTKPAFGPEAHAVKTAARNDLASLRASVAPIAAPVRDDGAREAVFLIERLREFQSEELLENQGRSWFGHVEPSIARLSILLAASSVSISVKGIDLRSMLANLAQIAADEGRSEDAKLLLSASTVVPCSTLAGDVPGEAQKSD